MANTGIEPDTAGHLAAAPKGGSVDWTVQHAARKVEPGQRCLLVLRRGCAVGVRTTRNFAANRTAADTARVQVAPHAPHALSGEVTALVKHYGGGAACKPAAVAGVCQRRLEKRLWRKWVGIRRLLSFLNGFVLV